MRFEISKHHSYIELVRCRQIRLPVDQKKKKEYKHLKVIVVSNTSIKVAALLATSLASSPSSSSSAAPRKPAFQNCHRCRVYLESPSYNLPGLQPRKSSSSTSLIKVIFLKSSWPFHRMCCAAAITHWSFIPAKYSRSSSGRSSKASRIAQMANVGWSEKRWHASMRA